MWKGNYEGIVSDICHPDLPEVRQCWKTRALVEHKLAAVVTEKVGKHVCFFKIVKWARQTKVRRAGWKIC